MDGVVEVRIPCGRIGETTIDRLTLLSDGFEDDGGAWADDGQWSETGSEPAAPWVTEEGDAVDEVERDEWEDMEVDGLDSGDSSGDDEEDGVTVDGGMPHVHSTGANMPDDDERWSRFEVLDEAPTDHAFIREPWSTSTQAFFSRIQKEFKILQNALPDSILVRTYGDRTDLLRVLIIGSENTPYEDAPFVIDFCLKPTYPHEPPLAHFHSWTNGNGRVSPNLYEEGKVCW
ncbi:unnamed protein product [Tilletia controversa]|nr:unnamed protein product [Tilletia controversa]